MAMMMMLKMMVMKIRIKSEMSPDSRNFHSPAANNQLTSSSREEKTKTEQEQQWAYEIMKHVDNPCHGAPGNNNSLLAIDHFRLDN